MTLRKIGIVALTLVLMVLVVFLVSRSFGYFNYMKKGDTLNVISIKGIDVEIINDSENNLNINEAYPMYDEEGMNNPPFEFTLTNNSNKALDIVLKIENDIDKQGEYPLLNMNYIRYSYKVGNGEYSTPSNLGENNIILTDTISKNETKEISIKLWIDKDAPNEVQGHYFFGQLIVEGTKALCTLEPGAVFNFDYNGTNGSDGSEQIFTAPCSGYYKLETWGAQGGSYNATYYGGYGAYSEGIKEMHDGDVVHINVGGSGTIYKTYRQGVINLATGGYNGGGYGISNGAWNARFFGSGGGATHMALRTGLLENLEQYKGSLSSNSQYYISDDILIVAGGGGGGQYQIYNNTLYKYAAGGSGGGMNGADENVLAMTGTAFANYYGQGGTQTSPGYTLNNPSYKSEFGRGFLFEELKNTNNEAVSGGGGGFYGGISGSGGSGYIANPNLTNKHMTCFNCTTSNETETKTISNTCHSATPTADCAKEENGYARITYLGNNTTTLYSAAVDEVYYYNSDNQKVAIGTTDETGKLENAIVPKNVVLYSSVAKDPNNLSNPYSKEFSNTSTNIYLMPEGRVLYWYGYGSDSLSIIKDVSSGSCIKNANEIEINHYAAVSYNSVVVYTTVAEDISKYSNEKIITSYTNNASHTQNLGVTNTTPNLTGQTFGNNRVSITPVAGVKLSIFNISNYSGNYYIGYETNAYPTKSYIHALWLD